jgi:hypothetical protein
MGTGGIEAAEISAIEALPCPLEFSFDRDAVSSGRDG